MVDLFEKHFTEPWEHYEFEDILSDDILKYLKLVNSYDFYEEHTKEDESQKNYDEKNLRYYKPSDPSLASTFTNKYLCSRIKRVLNVNFSHVDITLMDISGPRDIFLHCDDPEKKVSAIVYITDNGLDREIGTWCYSSNNPLESPHKKIMYRDNCGFIFSPVQNVTWHSTPQFRGENISRRCLLVNYVDRPTKWKTDSLIN